MTPKERLKQIMEMEEFAFIKDIPSDKLWKLIFAINFIIGSDEVLEGNKYENTFVDIQNDKACGSKVMCEVYKDIWQELKETITELRDSDGTLTQQEVCQFLVRYMEVLEDKER